MLKNICGKAQIRNGGLHIIMDFKEILETWEQSKTSQKQRTSARKLQEAWLDRHGVFDKDDAVSPETSNTPKMISNKELENIPLDGSIDLHGCTVKEAELLLEQFFTTAVTMRWRKVCIIHGKGNHSQQRAVLAKFVKNWLETCRYASRTIQAPAQQGGRGVLIVFIKQADKRLTGKN